MIWIIILALGIFNFLTKYLLLYKFPKQGNDSFLFLLYIEFFKKQKKIPVIFDELYMLENREMWYPPLLPVILSAFPQNIIKKWFWLISPIFDTLNVMLLALIIHINFHNTLAVVCSALIYAFSFSTINEVRSLTPRMFGVFLFNLVYLLLSYYYHGNGIQFLLWAFIPAIMILLSHKLTTQIFVFIQLTLTFFVGWSSLYFLIITLLVTLVLSKGFYLKILRSHFDYISFWNKQWPRMGGHQVLDSPVYGMKDKSQRILYQNNLKSYILFFLNQLYQNQYLVYPLIILSIFYSNDNIIIPYYSIIFSFIATLGFILSLMVYYLPILRGIGFGSQYGKYLSFSSLIAASGFFYHEKLKYYVIAHVILMSFIYLKFIYKYLHTYKNYHEFDKFQNMFKKVKTLHNPTIWCIPIDISDILAYECRVKVLWGGHGSPTNTLKDFLPVINKTIDEIRLSWHPTHLLIDKAYTDFYNKIENLSVEWQDHKFILFKFEEE